MQFWRDHAVDCDLVAECTVKLCLASAKCSCTRGICGQAFAGKIQGLHGWCLPCKDRLNKAALMLKTRGARLGLLDLCLEPAPVQALSHA